MKIHRDISPRVKVKLGMWQSWLEVWQLSMLVAHCVGVQLWVHSCVTAVRAASLPQRV